jgi:hypothetical protein
MVQYGPFWTLAASHECLELLADPDGNQRRTGSLSADNPEHVSFVVEICDPCQDQSFGYPIGSCWVSDFCTPQYYDEQASAGVQYSYRGHVTTPKQVLLNGALSWIDTTGEAHQAQNHDGVITVTDCGPYNPAAGPLREFMSAFHDGNAALSGDIPDLIARNRHRARAAAHAKASKIFSDKFRTEIANRRNATNGPAATGPADAPIAAGTASSSSTSKETET